MENIDKHLLTVNRMRKLDTGMTEGLEFGKEYFLTVRVSVAQIEREDNGDNTEQLTYKVVPVGVVMIHKFEDRNKDKI